MRKKTKKIEKRASVLVFLGRVGGLADAAGKVRKGKPSGYGDIRIRLEPRQHPVGVRRIEDASARPPHPEIVVTEDGVAQKVLGVYA